ncbi:hypothetical protein FE156_01885 [Streptomyces albidoflavus]|nr:hypothetical protein FE156_01885 [Streptomyces albidoflavus]
MARVAMIGGGVGGPAAALMLGRRGHRVTVFEQDARRAGDAASRWAAARPPGTAPVRSRGRVGRTSGRARRRAARRRAPVRVRRGRPGTPPAARCTGRAARERGAGRAATVARRRSRVPMLSCAPPPRGPVRR